MNIDYFNIGIFLVVAISISLLILGASYVIALQKGDSEKRSPYECGFTPFQDARQEFDVRFYVVAILFIIFDLEIIYLFPWSITLDALPMLGYGSMLSFLGLLTLGFMYEWMKGALDW